MVRRVLKSRRVRDFALITVGLALTAWALDAFLIPNKIAAGGVSGLATIILYWAKANFGVTLPVGTQMLVMNAALVAVAIRQRGLRYAAKTIYGIVMLSVFVDVFAPFTPNFAPKDLLLAALYGGAISGIGMGLVFKAGGNSGGTDIIAQLLARRLPYGVGQIMLVVDAAVTMLAAFVLGPTYALYGVVAIFVATTAIDFVLEGLPVERAVYVISDEIDSIAVAVTEELGRGATFLDATGAWTREPRGMLLVVLARNELDQLKQIVAAIDIGALVIISNVHETIGEGFREFPA
ncbi:MAG: YitT family protein [Coriobacteriales bacterium]|nr:YitT family protein [Coriobacteriales bacterium]